MSGGMLGDVQAGAQFLELQFQAAYGRAVSDVRMLRLLSFTKALGNGADSLHRQPAVYRREQEGQSVGRTNDLQARGEDVAIAGIRGDQKLCLGVPFAY